MMQSPNLVARPHFQMLFHMIYRMCLFLGLIHIIAYCNANYSWFNEVNIPFYFYYQWLIYIAI